MGVFGDILRVDDHAGVGHAALVVYLAEEHIEGAELGVDFGEVESPFGHGPLGGDHAGVVDVVELLDQSGASDEHLARRTCRIGERGLAERHKLLLGGERRILEGVVGLVPDAAGEEDVLLLVRVGDDALASEKEAALHAHAHVDDRCLLLVGEAPAHLFIGDFHESRLLYLGLIKV